MMFMAPSPEKIAAIQLYEARRLKLEHEAAAEHHAALAQMYASRVERLSPMQLTAKVEEA